MYTRNVPYFPLRFLNTPPKNARSAKKNTSEVSRVGGKWLSGIRVKREGDRDSCTCSVAINALVSIMPIYKQGIHSRVFSGFGTWGANCQPTLRGPLLSLLLSPFPSLPYLSSPSPMPVSLEVGPAPFPPSFSTHFLPPSHIEVGPLKHSYSGSGGTAVEVWGGAPSEIKFGAFLPKIWPLLATILTVFWQSNDWINFMVNFLILFIQNLEILK